MYVFIKRGKFLLAVLKFESFIIKILIVNMKLLGTKTERISGAYKVVMRRSESGFPVQWLRSRNPDFQIFNTSHGYGTSVTVRDVSHCTRLEYFTPVTVTGHQSLCEISATVRDLEHYIRDW